VGRAVTSNFRRRDKTQEIQREREKTLGRYTWSTFRDLYLLLTVYDRATQAVEELHHVGVMDLTVFRIPGTISKVFPVDTHKVRRDLRESGTQWQLQMNPADPLYTQVYPVGRYQHDKRCVALALPFIHYS
jgi:hypothetical protein